MNILVSGGNGFIGRHLVKALQAEGHRVWVLSRKAPDIAGDILEEDLDRRIPQEIEAVYHLAGMTSVGECIQNPGACLRANVLGTQNMLAIAKRRQVRRFIFVSSVYVYGDAPIYPTPEDACLFPNNPLGASKVGAEQMGRAYSLCYDLPVTVFRPFTVYGSGSGRHQFIPSLMEQVMSAQGMEVGEPRCTRDFIHVSDVVAGLVQSLRLTDKWSVFNLGTGVETSVAALIQLLLEIAQKPQMQVRFGVRPPRVDERHAISRQCADIRRAREQLSWQPQVSLRDGLMELFHQMETSKAHGYA